MPAIPNILAGFIILFAGLLVLIKAADYFNRSAESIGLSFGMSPFTIGILITAIGTSLPELITSIIAVNQGASEIVPGNVAGSNVTNIFLVVGLVAMVNRKPIELMQSFITVDLHFLVGSALFSAICMADGQFTFFEGVLSLMAFGVFFFYLVKSTKSNGNGNSNLSDIALTIKEEGTPPTRAGFKTWIILIISGAFIYIAAEMTIKSVVYVANFYDIGSGVVAAGLVALGTSLPELVVSLNAIKKGKSDYAIGNILGSSIFNSFWVLGFSSLFGTIQVSKEVRSVVIPFMLAATLLFYLLTRDKKVSNWEGFLYVVFYLLFLSKLIETL